VASAFMSAEKPRRTVGTDLHNGTTIDQIIARKIGQNNLMPSLQLALEDPGAQLQQLRRGLQLRLHEQHLVGHPDQALPMELNPQVVFERMFGEGGTAEERILRRSQNPQPARFADGQSGALSAAGSDRPTAAASTSTPRTFARSSAGCRSP
jgi:hypothetical protein